MIAPQYVRGFRAGWEAAMEFITEQWPDLAQDEDSVVAETVDRMQSLSTFLESEASSEG